MNTRRILRQAPALYPEPLVRELLDRPDAEETFARVAAQMPVDHPEPELTTVLTALAALRAREIAERGRR